MPRLRLRPWLTLGVVLAGASSALIAPAAAQSAVPSLVPRGAPRRSAVPPLVPPLPRPPMVGVITIEPEWSGLSAWGRARVAGREGAPSAEAPRSECRMLVARPDTTMLERMPRLAPDSAAARADHMPVARPGCRPVALLAIPTGRGERALALPPSP